MSFAELKKTRNARQATYFRPAPPATAPEQTAALDDEADAASSSKPDSQLYDPPDGLYSSLGDALEIRRSDIGRGLYVKLSRKQPIKPGALQLLSSRLSNRLSCSTPGSTILDVPPLVSALSTSCLATHCSYCHSEGSPTTATHGRTMKRCTLCKVIWYDTTVRVIPILPRTQ